MFTFILWVLLFLCCWPLAIFALVIYPLVWLILLPFRILGFAVSSILQAVWALAALPFRIAARAF
jgi:hypothetical protein